MHFGIIATLQAVKVYTISFFLQILSKITSSNMFTDICVSNWIPSRPPTPNNTIEIPAAATSQVYIA